MARTEPASHRWIVGIASACVAVPSVVAAVHALRWGWVPVSDQATVGTRAAEVLTTRTPRLGQLSGASAQVGLPTRSPGPMGYWPFAVTARWGPLWGSVIVAAALSGGSMVASVRLAARRGGPALALAVAAGLVLAARSINPANLVSTWNPAVGVMPLVLLVFLAWSVAVGEVRLLPVAVLTASFCAQAHTAPAVAVIPVLAIAAAVGLAPGVRRAVATLRAGERWRPGRAARSLAVAAVVGLGCWALPLVDQATGDPGNLTRLSRAGADEPFAWRGVARSVVDVVGVVPAFLRGDRSPAALVEGVLLRPSAALPVVTSVLVLAALVGLAVTGVRRRQRDLVVPPVLVLTLLLAGALVARGTPETQFLVLTYALWWTVPVGMLAWVVVGWGTAMATGWGTALARRLDARVAPLGAALVGLVVVAIAVSSPGQAEPEEPIHDEARAVGDAVVAQVEPGERYLVTSQGATGSQLVASTAYRIRRAGALPVVPGVDGDSAGPRHVPQGRTCAAIVTVTSGPEPVPDGEVVAELRLPSREGRSSDIVVTVGPDVGGPSC